MIPLSAKLTWGCLMGGGNVRHLLPAAAFKEGDSGVTPTLCDCQRKLYRKPTYHMRACKLCLRLYEKRSKQGARTQTDLDQS